MARSTAQQAAQTRERIMAAARTLFSAQGYAGTSTSAIARTAGVSDGAIFHHFGSKSALFTELAEAIHIDVRNAVRAAAMAADNPIETVLAGVRETIVRTTDPQIFRIGFWDAPLVFGSQGWRRVVEPAYAMLDLGLRIATGRRDIRDIEVEAMAIAIVGMMSELAYRVVEFDEARRNQQICACMVIVRQLVEGWVMHQRAA